MGLKMVRGVLTGGFSGQSLRRLLGVSNLAGKIKAHYLQYPEDPAEFPEWERTARRLWAMVSR